MSKQYTRVFNAKTITGSRPGSGDDLYLTNDLIPSEDNFYNVGSVAFKWRSVFGYDGVFSNNMNVGGTISANSVVVADTLTVGGGIAFDGDVQVGNNLTVDGDTVMGGTLDVDGNTTVGGTITSQSILPSVDNLYDLGSSTNRWRTIYTSNFNLDTGSALEIGDINDTIIQRFDEPSVIADRTFVTPRLHSTSYIVSPFISTMGFTQVDKFYASRTTDTTSKTDSDAAVKIDGGVAIAKRAWADAFQADTEMRTSSLTATGNTTVGGTLGVTGNTTVGGTLGVTGATTLSTSNTTGNASVGGNLSVTGKTYM
jgi:hypothetical protein